jgi:hypothetical protein
LHSIHQTEAVELAGNYEIAGFLDDAFPDKQEVWSYPVLGTTDDLKYSPKIGYHCRLDDFAHLGVGVHLAGGVKVGASAWMQAGSSAGYRVEVPAGSVVLPGTGLCADRHD